MGHVLSAAHPLKVCRLDLAYRFSVYFARFVPFFTVFELPCFSYAYKKQPEGTAASGQYLFSFFEMMAIILEI
jgi:hypothetical protein